MNNNKERIKSLFSNHLAQILCGEKNGKNQKLQWLCSEVLINQSTVFFTAFQQKVHKLVIEKIKDKVWQVLIVMPVEMEFNKSLP